MSHVELSWLPIKGTSWPGACPLQGGAQRVCVLSKHTESWLLPHYLNRWAYSELIRGYILT